MDSSKVTIDGNTAAGLGCMYAGATVGAWYPITPSTSLMDAFRNFCSRYRVDPETGKVDIKRYTVIQDAGRAIHPAYVEGQFQGGAAQGIGWALNEEYIYNKDGKSCIQQMVDVYEQKQGSVIGTQDLPPEMGGTASQERATQDWTRSLASWAERQLSAKSGPLLDTALPEFEKTLIQIAMSQTGGHRQEAAKLLGWGRNTLTRKMKSLHLD